MEFWCHADIYSKKIFDPPFDFADIFSSVKPKNVLKTQLFYLDRSDQNAKIQMQLHNS